MSNNANLGWSVSDAEVMKSFQKMQSEVDKLKGKLKEVGEENKRATDIGIRGFGEIDEAIGGGVGELKAMVLGLASVGTAVGMIKAEFDDWAQRIDNVSKASRDFTNQLVADLRRAGDVGRADEISAGLAKIPGVTQQQRNALFGGLTESGPSLNVPQRLELAAAAAPLARAGADPTELRRLAGVMGELSDMAPGKSADDIADLAQGLSQLTRGDFAKLGGPKALSAIGKLQESGASLEESLGYAAAALDANQNPAVVSKLAALSVGELKARKWTRTKPLTEEDLAFNRAAAVSGAARRELLMSDRSVAQAVGGDDFALALAQIKREVVAERTEQFRAFQRGNVMQGVPEMLATQRSGAMVMLEQSGRASEQVTPALAAPANAEELIERLEPSLRAANWSYSARHGFAMRIRTQAFFGRDPSAYALSQLEGSPETGGRTAGWLGTSRELSPEEKKNWNDMLQYLRTIAAKADKADAGGGKPVAINGHTERRP